MTANIKDNKVPSSLISCCPVCGKEMTTHLRIDERFVQDDGWYKERRRYDYFLDENKIKKFFFLN